MKLDRKTTKTGKALYLSLEQGRFLTRRMQSALFDHPDPGPP